MHNSLKIIHLVEKLYEEKFHSLLHVTSMVPVGGGCINYAVRLETNLGYFFLKWNEKAEPDIFLREEESLLEMRLVDTGELLVPEPLLSKIIDNSLGFLLSEWLPPGQTAHQDEKLGRGLALLHQKSNMEFGFAHDNYCGETPQSNRWNKEWIAFYRDERLKYLIERIRAKRGWNVDDYNVSDKFLYRLSSLIPPNNSPSLVHGDLWSGNYMYTSNGPAIFDPACSYSHREFEFGILTMFGGFSNTFFDAYNETFPLEHNWRERVPLYRLYHLLNHYLLFGGAYKTEALEIMKRA